MSMINDMMADMLKKAIPKEALDLLTTENIASVIRDVSAFAAELNKRLTNIERGMGVLEKKIGDLENERQSRNDN
jgi:hypothetical protein